MQALVSSGLTIVTLSSSAPEQSISKFQDYKMLWSESCCRKTLQPLPLHSSIVCTGSLFTPESVSKLPQSLTSPNGQNLSYTLLPCGTNICQSETSVYPIHCFFLPTRQKKFRLACFSFCCTNYLEQISTIHQNCTFHSIVQSPP